LPDGSARPSSAMRSDHMIAETPAHRFDVRVYFEDTDFSGIVYHANSLKFLERGRTEALRDRGIAHSALASGPDPVFLTVRRITLSWARPAMIDDLLTVETRFQKMTGARMNLDQRLCLTQRDATPAPADTPPLVSASVEIACLDRDGRLRRLPALILSRLANMTAE